MLLNAEKEEYIVFADPAVEQICATKWGDGVGITPSQAARVTSLGTTFRGNDNIVYFNELKYFTGLTSLSAEAFYDCHYLKEVTLPTTVTIIGSYAFRYATRLSILIHDGVENAEAGDIILPYLTGFGASNAIFQEAYAIKNAKNLGSITATPYQVFYKCSNLVSIVLPATVTSIGGQLIQNTGVMTIVCYATTPPSVGSNAFRTGSTTKRVTVYVPYSADHSILAAYQSAPGWSGNGYGTGLKQILELDENGNIPT